METDTHTGRMPCQGKGRDWGDAAEAKKCQRLPANLQKLGVRHARDYPSQPLEGTNTAGT